MEIFSQTLRKNNSAKRRSTVQLPFIRATRTDRPEKSRTCSNTKRPASVSIVVSKQGVMSAASQGGLARPGRLQNSRPPGSTSGFSTLTLVQPVLLCSKPSTKLALTLFNPTVFTHGTCVTAPSQADHCMPESLSSHASSRLHAHKWTFSISTFSSSYKFLVLSSKPLGIPFWKSFMSSTCTRTVNSKKTKNTSHGILHDSSKNTDHLDPGKIAVTTTIDSETLLFKHHPPFINKVATEHPSHRLWKITIHGPFPKPQSIERRVWYFHGFSKKRVVLAFADHTPAISTFVEQRADSPTALIRQVQGYP